MGIKLFLGINMLKKPRNACNFLNNNDYILINYLEKCFNDKDTHFDDTDINLNNKKIPLKKYILDMNNDISDKHSRQSKEID